MRTIVTFLLLISGLFCSSALASHDHDTKPEHLVFSESLHAHLSWETGPMITEESVLKIEFVNPIDNTPVDLANDPEVVLWMPHHGHGSAPTVVEAVLDSNRESIVGSFRVSNIFFVMAGMWDVKVTLTDNKGLPETRLIKVMIDGDKNGGHQH